MRARKLGYAPQERAFLVDTAGGSAAFSLMPLARALPPIVSSAARGGLSGVVGDTAFNPIKGAKVRVLSAGIETRTDSLGAFYIPVKPGSYMVAITRDSFASRLVSVAIPRDSGRRITAWLQPRTGAQSQQESWNIANLSERRAWIKQDMTNNFFTREDLIRLKIEWIYDAVQMTAARNGAKEAYSRNCTVAVNGGASATDLSTLTIDDVESVEVYPSFSSTSNPTVAAAAPKAKHAKVKGGTFGTFTTNPGVIIDNSGLNCPGVYVWLR
jgi:hypothetical protein